MRRQRWIAAIAVTLTGAVAADARASCQPSVTTAVPQPTAAELDAAGLGRLPLAPTNRRVDLVAPPFTKSTTITNPLFPISNLRSAILNGHVDGKPLKIETTLLPDTRVIEWSPGQCVRTLVSQFVAYEAGRIQEVALDFYAQADDGSVWYFGEDVFNYRRGVVNDTGGTWLAGKEGPAAMIMPAQPTVGMVYRPENIAGLVFEEVTVKRTGERLVVEELHQDGAREDKLFAPGYGEFRSADATDLEAMALAVPTDALAGPMPATLARLHRAAFAGRLRAARAAWRKLRGVPPRLAPPMRRALRKSDAFGVADAALDLQLQYRPPAQIDRERLVVWARRARADARAGRRAALSGDAATLTWIRDRIARDIDAIDRVRLDRRLGDLEAAAADGELRPAARAARNIARLAASL
jgi:hypothetical protein